MDPSLTLLPKHASQGRENAISHCWYLKQSNYFLALQQQPRACVPQSSPPEEAREPVFGQQEKWEQVPSLCGFRKQ